MKKKGKVKGALVEWREGVHLVGTPIWCDAKRTREACFVSSALSPEARRHRQIIATEATIALLGEGQRPLDDRAKSRRPQQALVSPVGRPFTLGNERVELFPSGHVVGAASLSVEPGGGGPRVVYAGAVDVRGGRIAGSAEARACDTLVLDATYGHARFQFPPVAAVLAQLAAWVADVAGSGGTPVLLASPLAVGPDLIRRLGATVALRAHRSFVEVARRLRALGLELPPVHRFAGTPAPGDVVLWPASGRDAPALASLRKPRVALVGGLAQDPDVMARLQLDTAFAVGEQADHESLLQYVAQSSAVHVYLLGSGAAELVKVLRGRGLDAQQLGPPEQLWLALQ